MREMVLDTLYNRDSKKKVQSWAIKALFNDETGFSEISSDSGHFTGKKTNKTVIIEKGKNIGKANETSSYEQACNEAQSKWKSKRRKGYKSLEDLGIFLYGNAASSNGNSVNLYAHKETPTVPKTLEDILNEHLPLYNTDMDNNPKPMKAQPYFRDNGTPRNVNFPCILQNKLNGMRCTMAWDEETYSVAFRSKEGLRYTNLFHIQVPKDMFGLDGEIIFDGELYVHGLDLQSIRSAVLTPSLMTEAVRFHCYDLAIPNVKQYERLRLLKELFTNFKPEGVVKEESIVAKSHEEIIKFKDEAIKKGFEGAIIRDLQALYCFGQRPVTMLKLKNVYDGEFKILDIIDSRDNPGIAIFVLKNDINHFSFESNPKGTEEQKREYFTNKAKYIGKFATTEYRERTKKPKELPFHTNVVTVRDYE